MKNLILPIFGLLTIVLTSCVETPFEKVEPLIESKGYYNLEFQKTNTAACRKEDTFALEYKAEDAKGKVHVVIACTDQNGDGIVKKVK